MGDGRESDSTRPPGLVDRRRVGPSSTRADSSTPSRWPASQHIKRLPVVLLIGGIAAAVAMALVAPLPKADAQPEKYMDGAAWRNFLADGKGEWFARWNAMAQPRINQLAAIAESEREGGGGAGPFRVAIVGDSTMMQQHGVLCAFLGERPGRRFDPAVHQEECCVDTLPREHPKPGRVAAAAAADNNNSSNKDPTLALGSNSSTSKAGSEGGRGLCFRHHFERFAEPPEWASLGSPDAVYFGVGLHLLHMTRQGLPLEGEKVRGWLNYEKDLEHAVDTYRAEGGDGFRLVFTTCHTIQDSVYRGDFEKGVRAYRDNDSEWISVCEKQRHKAAGGVTGPEGYGVDTYCRQGLMDRNGSDIINSRSRPVMARLGVPVVEGDLIVRDQEWATPSQDGRHYPMLVPVEVWELLGILVSPFVGDAALTSV